MAVAGAAAMFLRRPPPSAKQVKPASGQLLPHQCRAAGERGSNALLSRAALTSRF